MRKSGGKRAREERDSLVNTVRIYDTRRKPTVISDFREFAEFELFYWKLLYYTYTAKLL